MNFSLRVFSLSERQNELAFRLLDPFSSRSYLSALRFLQDERRKCIFGISNFRRNRNITQVKKILQANKALSHGVTFAIGSPALVFAKFNTLITNTDFQIIPPFCKRIKRNNTLFLAVCKSGQHFKIGIRQKRYVEFPKSATDVNNPRTKGQGQRCRDLKNNRVQHLLNERLSKE